MKMYNKFFVIIVLFILSGVCLFAGGKKDDSANSVKTSDPNEKQILITGFEDSSKTMRLYQGTNSTFTVGYTTKEKYEGKQSAEVKAMISDWTGVEIVVPEGKGDWSSMKTLMMWTLGKNSGSEIKVVIEDSQKEQFTSSFYETHSDWYQVAIPLSSFTSRDDWQNDDTEINKQIDYPVRFLHFFTSYEGNITMYYDLITVSDKQVKIEKQTETDFVVPKIEPVYTLKDLAEYHNLTIGAAASISELKQPDINRIILRDFDSITATNEMKFYVIKRNEDKYRLEFGDTIVDFAQEHSMKARGHTLVWHQGMPAWVEKGNWTKESLLAYLKEYITTVVKHYKGRVYCWDVVNEVFDDTGGFRGADTSVWYRICGEEYIEKAFIWAHEADPDALLFINDYGVAEINAKSTATYNYVKTMLAKGVPIHGFGAQMHLIEEEPPSYRRIYKNMERFSQLGLEIHFTEMDVRIKGKVTKKKLKHQAEIYTEIIKIAMKFPKITSVTLWGVSDKFSWVPSAFPGYGSPLLFTEEYNPKPAYFDMQLALLRGPGEFDYLADISKRHPAVPFKAIQCTTVPKCDGEIAPGEWDDAIEYPFGYNQLSTTDLTMPDKSDLDASWRVLYKGNTIYGLVVRKDDQTTVNAKAGWDNDNIEVFFDIDNEFAQLRTIVRHNFEEHRYKGKRIAVWNRKGDVLEFSVELPPAQLEGKIIGWNIALSDNDNKKVRDHQLYPVNGINVSYKGEDFGEIEFVSKNKPGKRFGIEHLIMPFKINPVDTVPVIDGKMSSGEWKNGIVYPFVYNQINSKHLILPDASDISGNWRIVYKGNTIYGMVQRVDNKIITDKKTPEENDSVDISFDVNNTFVQLSTIVNRDFGNTSYSGKSKAVWSAAGDMVEFSIELPAPSLRKLIIGFNIALSDNDGSKSRNNRLFPVNGTNKEKELGEIRFIE